jgi:alcohol dehydrogenase class IV
MWFFVSPQIVFGEQSLSYLERLEGRRACIVSDANLLRLGLVERVKAALAPTGMQVMLFSEVEPDPSLEVVRRGASQLLDFQPDWIIALGGGSAIDTAKAMWVLYERPDMQPDAINPVEKLGLRQKARLCAIPTTTGTGSEVTWAIVLTDLAERRKLALGSRENVPDLAILDPELAQPLPPYLTAETGLDALTQAIEGYTSAMHNDFCDGLCLQAARLVFEWLPRAVADGDDLEARTHTQNAAAMAGLGFGNSMSALAHGLGHSLGAVFHTPHGQAVGLFLPYAIEYCARGEPGSTRYAGLARFLGLMGSIDLTGFEKPVRSGDPVRFPDNTEEQQAAACLVEGVRRLERQIGQPLTLAECGITRQQLEAEMDTLAWNALGDSQTVMSTRIPGEEDIRRLFLAAWEGTKIDF